MTTIIVLLLRLYEILIFIRVILSWVQVDPSHQLVELLYRWTEPVLEPIRRLLGGDKMMFDFSPLVVLFALQLLEQGLLRIGM